MSDNTQGLDLEALDLHYAIYGDAAWIPIMRVYPKLSAEIRRLRAQSDAVQQLVEAAKEGLRLLEKAAKAAYCDPEYDAEERYEADTGIRKLRAALSALQVGEQKNTNRK